jgi:hypothetical protein
MAAQTWHQLANIAALVSAPGPRQLSKKHSTTNHHDGRLGYGNHKLKVSQFVLPVDSRQSAFGIVPSPVRPMKMRFAWYASVSKLPRSSSQHSQRPSILTFLFPGLGCPCRRRGHFGLPSEGQLLLGHGAPLPEQSVVNSTPRLKPRAPLPDSPDPDPPHRSLRTLYSSFTVPSSTSSNVTASAESDLSRSSSYTKRPGSRSPKHASP